MSALAKNISQSKEPTSVTKINANARIDYILRFSKQAILVIDETSQQGSDVSSQHLATLPEQRNIAFVALSSQFNDIQVRCRIIEQLFNSDLFDPEISLAVSIINFAKQSKQSISIIIDNSQHASLQIIHELCQLAAIAKKTNLSIDVVMFGNPDSGRIIAANKSLFNNKLALLSAQSGQLLSTGAHIFKETKHWYNALADYKWFVVVFSFLLIAAVSVIMLLQHNNFTFAKPLAIEKIPTTQLAELTAEPAVSTKFVQEKIAKGPQTEKSSEAQVSDIFISLTQDQSELQVEKKVSAASPSDIVNAMAFLGTKNIESSSNNNKIRQPTTEASDPASLIIDNDYFLSYKQGFVIQLAVFSETKLPESFLNVISELGYHAYWRTLNDKAAVVITGERFLDRNTAEQALTRLPEALTQRQPWIKSISAINNEIIAYQSSQ